MPTIEELEARVELGFVRRIPHATLPLTIYNYTDRCAWERGWDAVTEAARGLVVDREGAVVARPFGKFFNLGERPETQAAALPSETPELTEKYDGSLIIAFYFDGRWMCCTRGSWESEQARWAQDWLDVQSQTWPESAQKYTLMFELCAPWNRIVVQYLSTKMVLIGAISQAADLSHVALRELARELGACPSELKLRADPASVELAEGVGEGYVARYSNGFRVKLKFATYMRLHKLLTGLSVKSIWETLASGVEADVSHVPDEFMAWYTEQRNKLTESYGSMERAAILAFVSTDKAVPRGDIARQWAKLPERAVLFRMLDGRDYSDVIWKAIKPERGGETTFQKDEA
jgi:RNA ligase